MSIGENELRCNAIECRIVLAHQGKAVVTTCSHIFCIRCANDLFAQQAVCPACQRELPEANDIVESHLNPSSDYRASILAGLSPNIIMEIAARAMAFWTYQTSQESKYQTIMLERAKESLGEMERRYVQAQGDLQSANRKIMNLKSELDHAERRNQALGKHVQQNREELLKMKGNYDRIKGKALLGSTQLRSNDDRTKRATRPAGEHPSHAANLLATRLNHHKPVGNQPPQPFIPTPSAVEPHNQAKTRRDDLQPVQRISVPRQPDFQQNRSAAHHGIPIPGTYEKASPFDSREPLAQIHINQNSSRSAGDGFYKKGTSKLARRKTDGPSDFGAKY